MLLGSFELHPPAFRGGASLVRATSAAYSEGIGALTHAPVSPMFNPFRWWGSRESSRNAEGSRRPVPVPVDVIRGLRNQVLSLEPAQIGVVPTPERPRVWGILMETGYAEALATLVALADGTTSLYLGHGGGVIGGGEHARVRSAAQDWFGVAEEYHDELAPTRSFPLPDIGGVRLYLLTFGGARTAYATEQELGSGKHPLSPFFFRGHAVLAALREISEAPRT